MNSQIFWHNFHYNIYIKFWNILTNVKWLDVNCHGFTQGDSLHDDMKFCGSTLYHRHQSSMLNKAFDTGGKFSLAHDTTIACLVACWDCYNMWWNEHSYNISTINPVIWDLTPPFFMQVHNLNVQAVKYRTQNLGPPCNVTLKVSCDNKLIFFTCK